MNLGSFYDFANDFTRDMDAGVLFTKKVLFGSLWIFDQKFIYLFILNK